VSLPCGRIHFEGLAQLRDRLIVIARVQVMMAKVRVDAEAERVQFPRPSWFRSARPRSGLMPADSENTSVARSSSLDSERWHGGIRLPRSSNPNHDEDG
jgi:hypothetical protein